jgi:hypothetical protein
VRVGCWHDHTDFPMWINAIAIPNTEPGRPNLWGQRWVA